MTVGEIIAKYGDTKPELIAAIDTLEAQLAEASKREITCVWSVAVPVPSEPCRNCGHALNVGCYGLPSCCESPTTREGYTQAVVTPPTPAAELVGTGEAVMMERIRGRLQELVTMRYDEADCRENWWGGILADVAWLLADHARLSAKPPATGGAAELVAMLRLHHALADNEEWCEWGDGIRAHIFLDGRLMRMEQVSFLKSTNAQAACWLRNNAARIADTIEGLMGEVKRLRERPEYEDLWKQLESATAETTRLRSRDEAVAKVVASARIAQRWFSEPGLEGPWKNLKDALAAFDGRRH